MSVSLADPVIAISGNPAVQHFVLHMDGVDEKIEIAPLVMRDLESPKPPELRFSFAALELGRSSKSRDWLVTMTVEGFPPNRKQQRYLEVTASAAGGAQAIGLPVDKPVAYTLTSQGTPVVSLIAPPPEISIGPESSLIPFSLVVGATPLSGVQLAQPALVEDGAKTEVAVELCGAAGTDCGKGPRILAADTTHRLALRTPDGAAAGNYSGALVLALAEKPDGIAINLKLHVSGFWRRVVGVLAVLLGVAVAFFVTVYARHLANRDQILLPFILMRGKLADIRAALDKAPAACKASTASVEARLGDRLQDIDDKTLQAKGILPGRIPSAFGAQTAVQLQSAKDLVNIVNTWLVALDEIVIEGMAAVWAEAARDPANATLQSRAQVQTAALDQLGSDPTTPPAADAIRRTIAAALAAMRPAPAAAALAPSVSQPRTFRQVQLQLDAVNAGVWVVLLFISIIVGVAATVLKNGFGTPMDYLTCILWGFGVPLSGAQLTSLSPKGVATSLGISVAQ